MGTTVVAVFNTSDDVVEMLRYAIEAVGFVVVSGHLDAIRRGDTNLSDLVGRHDPRVIVYDIAPPYERSWRFLEHLRESSLMKGRAFVLTTTNPKRLREIVGTSEHVHEIIGKPYDLDEIVRAVQQAAGSPAQPSEPGRSTPETDPIDR